MTDTMISCFLAAVKTLNFTTAAENMHITQPAFSRNIVQLEEEIGFPLFLRSKKNGLRVTPAGLEFYNGLNRLKDDYDALLERAKSINRGETGELVVGIISGNCVDSKTMKAVKMFQQNYPKMKILLKCYSVSTLLEAVTRGDCDICMMIGAATMGSDDLLSEEIFELENYLFVPRNIELEEKDTYSLWDFREQTFILSEDVPMINELLTNICRQTGFIPKTIMAPDYETKMLWCEMGMGISINGEDHYMKNSPNISLIKVEELKPDSYSVIWNKSNYNPGIALFYSMYDEIMSS